MKLAVFAFILLMICPCAWGQESAQPFAVVEFFGSEGCSSCPPADDFLRALVKETRENNTRVFPLSFHVDYWNNLGWKDPFSRRAFTERQSEYGKKLNVDTYTPQMFVNGTYAFVGADRRSAQKYITEALRTPPENSIVLKAQITADTLEVTYHCGKAVPGAVIHAALVERGVVSEVPRGENAGRTLTHDNVVREFKTVPLQEASGKVELVKPPAGLENFSIIAYIQDTRDLKITAADSVDLRQEE